MSQSSDPSAEPRRTSGAAPPRPALSVTVPSPLDSLASPPPRTVAVSFLLWLASLVVGFAVAGYAFTQLDDLRPELRAAILAEDPTITAESLDQVVNASLYAALGALLAFIVAEALLAATMHRGRNWARVLLAALGLVSVPTFIIVRGVLSLGQPITEDYVLVGLALQELLMLSAVVVMFLPSANAWFRH